MLPRKFAPVLFALILSAMMSFVVSGISTLRAVGAVPGFFGIWLGAWLIAWPSAFPVALFAAPVVRRIVAQFVQPE